MKKYTAFVTVLTLCFFVFGPITTARATDAVPGKEISKEEAAKTYPPPKGMTSYPEGTATTTSTGGFFRSPYSSRIYDCRTLKKGALILDEGVKKVFVRP